MVGGEGERKRTREMRRREGERGRSAETGGGPESEHTRAWRRARLDNEKSVNHGRGGRGQGGQWLGSPP